jgi:16S rRNA A1518/A1519 N6-dimethyltransferase RsmA/KsgA/DIM1 with predicted DNA glycosylase/AP lyase activity
LLREKHGPALTVQHADVLQVDYADLVKMADDGADGEPLTIIGNLPYYITSEILFALADAAHRDAVRSATVTMQWEVGQRLVARTCTKDYGILSVVFQLYCAKVQCHFKIPPTVFYPQPKVDSALLGLHFLSASQLQQRLAGVAPRDLRKVVTATFQQRRKTVRNSLKKLLLSYNNLEPDAVESILQSPPLPLPEIVQAAADAGDSFAQRQALPDDWAAKRPEELTPGQFVELTRLVLGANGKSGNDLGYKVWRKLKHGKSNS